MDRNPEWVGEQDRRKKDRVTLWHQWITLGGIPLITTMLITFFGFVLYMRDDTRDHTAELVAVNKSLEEIKMNFPRIYQKLADHDTRISVIESNSRFRPLGK